MLLGLVVACSALALFGVADMILHLWQHPFPDVVPDVMSDAANGYFGLRPFDVWLFVVPLGMAALISLILLVLAPDTPVELADVIGAAHQPDPTVPQINGYASTLKSVLAVGGGSSTGLYGPLIVLGTSLAVTARRVLRLSPQYGEMALGAGVAAAIASAFGAPLAGIVFAHEVVLRHYSLRFFAPVSVASVSAYVVSGAILPTRFDLLPTLSTPPAQVADIALLMLLGVGIGLLAVMMMQVLARSRSLAHTIALPYWVRPLLAAVIIGAVAHLAPAALGPGMDVLGTILQGQVSAVDLAGLIGVKIILASVCLALFFHGGVLAPALFVGGGLGALFATLLVTLAPWGYQPDIALFALAGMSAMASCVVGAPLAMILISFELTHDYSATTALVVTIVLANLLSSRLYARSVFESQLFVKGLDLSLGRESLALQSTPVTHIMSSDYLALPEHASVAEATAQLAAAQCAEAHLQTGDGKWRGKICLYNLIAQPPDAPCLPLIDTAPLTLQASDNALQAQNAMRDFIGEGVPVLDGEIFHGVVYEADLFRHARMVTRSVWQHDHEDAAPQPRRFATKYQTIVSGNSQDNNIGQ